MCISEHYGHPDPMTIYETWSYELLYDVHRVLDYLDDLRKEAERKEEQRANERAKQRQSRRRR